MAKNKKKKVKRFQNYAVGYCKPPEEFKWKKGCKSPNPKGRPKKITSIKEALKVNLGKEITTRNENGEEIKISCADALARKTLKDAISKDGPTRRMLYRNDLLNLEAMDPIIEYDQDTKEFKRVEKDYGDLLKQWASMPEKIRDAYSKILSEAIRDIAINKLEGEI